jgi:ABC-2 type transport system ATP-binding protein
VLVVDEPTVGLDPRSVRLLKDVLRRLSAEGTTVFLSTHSLDIAQELAQRIGIVDRGRLIGCGPLEALRRQADSNGSLEEVFLLLTEEATSDQKPLNGQQRVTAESEGQY